MREAVSAAGLYVRYLGISIRSQMQYRASFWMLTFGQLLVTGIEFLGVWALFSRFGGLRGWTLPEAGLLYGVANIAFAIAEAFARGFDQFSFLVKSGDFDRVLLRPRSTALQIAGMELQLMRAGRLAQGLLVLVWAATRLQLAWSPGKAALLIAMIAGGACLFYGLFVIQAVMAFWTVETLEIMNTVTYGGTQTAQYPLTIYRPMLRRFFTFVVPLVCMNYLPADALLDHVGPLGLSPIWQWTSPGVGAAFLLASLQAWHFGVRRYRSTGS